MTYSVKARLVVRLILASLFTFTTSSNIEAMSTVSGKVCAIFGFGPGVGTACAKKWASKGFKVAIMARSMDKLELAEKTIANSKGYACDVTNPESMKATVAAIETDLGPIHSVVYNAGSGVWKTWDKIEMNDFDMAMKTNTHGLLTAAQLIAPGMIERGEGAIMITGATASMRGKPFTAGFAPAKGAQRLLAQALARDLGPKGVHVGLFIIDGQIGVDDTDPKRIDPNAIADTYWNVATQPKTCWSFETEVRPSLENW
jgi:NADP-dependent 3-hydroxy acid dehydrogenase YdfG